MKLIITAFLETGMWRAMRNGEFVKLMPMLRRTSVSIVWLNETEPLFEASLLGAYLGAKIGYVLMMAAVFTNYCSGGPKVIRSKRGT